MKVTKSLLLHLLVAGALYATSAQAAPTPPAEDYVKSTQMYIDTVVNDDGTEVATYTLGTTILHQNAVEYMKKKAITYSTSAEKIDIIKAHTHKADGRDIAADPNSFQMTVNGGHKGAAPAFSDRTSLTVVFPDVAVGDTTVLIYTKTVTDPLFPGKFSNLHHFPKDSVFEDVRIRYSIPTALNPQYENFALHETVNKQENGRHVLEWTYCNTTSETTDDVVALAARIGDSPALAISTFPSYQAIAESYGARARPKAAVTDEIRTLADTIAGDKAGPRDQAKALYDWVVEHLTYGGNCIGIGAVVPRDLPVVLANKMGDCKDHATLLQALLQAKGIASTQALIGVNRLYTLPKTPLVSVVNHVINYIPSLDLYIDATAGLPFGALPRAFAGKPVLLVDGYKEGTTIPKRQSKDTQLKTVFRLKINEKGTAEGVTTISLQGEHAFASYKRFRDVLSREWESLHKEMLRQTGHQGMVELQPGQWDEGNLQYSYEIKFRLEEYVRPGAPGAFTFEPPFALHAIASAIEDAAQNRKEKVTRDFLCDTDLIEENFSYEFPDNITILAVPNNVSAATAVQEYRSEYTLSGKTLTVSRRLSDTSPAPVCKPEVYDAYVDLAIKVWPDLTAQVVYK